MTARPPAPRIYYLVCGALLALLLLTVAVSFIDLGAFNVPLALAIAVAKALLVALFFMHLRDAVPLTRLVAVAGLAWLLVLFLLTFGDYATRGWMQ
ncbi:MAG TPA: cytochrome C oxidase subunit IV family protein [Candidatus Sumerlaeota bacterium]|nr:cytochrome C oxidase subunit IV family protein [Candidatus Sumerlaeota bacterium]